ncbi:MAG: MBL fold metallo-hydrolase, partial [Phycisphaerae bacterium]|nr:MBL fold metallo-hydrolase [Phycisphaerae bacterium]
MFQVNTLLLWPDGNNECWIVDPGFQPAAQTVLEKIAELGLTPAAILLTHGHGDHIAGVGEIRTAFADVPIIAPAGDAHMLTDPNANLSAGFGVSLTVPA